MAVFVGGEETRQKWSWKVRTGVSGMYSDLAGAMRASEGPVFFTSVSGQHAAFSALRMVNFHELSVIFEDFVDSLTFVGSLRA